MKRWVLSLRARLALLVILAVTPAAGLDLYAAWRDQRGETARAKDQALQFARVAAAAEQQAFDSMRQLLIGLAQVSSVQDGDGRSCSRLFAEIVRKDPRYIVLGAAGPNGSLFCSSLPLTSGVSVAYNVYFHRMLGSSASVSEYRLARITRAPTVNYAHPVLNTDGKSRGVVFGALDISVVNRLVASARLPTGASLLVVDRTGIIATRHPNSEEWSGRSILARPFVTAILSSGGDGIVTAPDLDDTPSFFGFTPLLGDRESPPAYVAVGLPRKAALAAARERMLSDFSILVLVGALVIIAVWLGGSVLVLRPVGTLVAATRRLRDGDLSARTGLDYRVGEMGELAKAVDAMAESLETKRLSDRLTALYRTSALVSSSLDPNYVIHQVVQATQSVMGYSHVVVMTVQGELLIPAAWAGYTTPIPELRIDQGVTGRVARTGEPAFVPDVSKDPDFVPHEGDTSSEIACPIIVDGRISGVLNVETVGAQRLTSEDLDLLNGVAAHLSVALRNALEHERARMQATQDGLTGLMNHASFHLRLREELERARRHGRALALLLADLDNFKRLNDAYGHLTGDRVLRLFADIIRIVIRGEDVAARYGGEEFAVILPETDAEGARLAAERIRHRLRRDGHLLVDGMEIAVTASFGVAAFPAHADNSMELIRRADQALYKAKRSGKNTVRQWKPTRAESTSA